MQIRSFQINLISCMILLYKIITKAKRSIVKLIVRPRVLKTAGK
jgi:hypothetical protein